jgi:hypothetical protein
MDLFAEIAVAQQLLIIFVFVYRLSRMLHCAPNAESLVARKFREYHIFLRHDAERSARRTGDTALKRDSSGTAPKEISDD